ncbi:MAG: D-2-hydroxyacid dehydrogenase, partial [Myxococcales bacterium]|nr:D-2-hydroxyacid dehydrogenase [Myxococcales bacterium]
MKFVFYPPQRRATRQWAERLSIEVPGLQVVAPEDAAVALAELRDADAAFGTLPKAALAVAAKLRWLQAPAAAPPAGYYYPELVQHALQVTNFREIYNDHIANHVLAFVLAFARGFQQYIPQQLAGQWQPARVGGGVVHLAEA